MAEKESGKHGPSLELPSLGLRRRRRRSPEAEPAARPEPSDAEAPARAEPTVESPTPSRRRLLPAVGGMTASVITGAVVGALAVGLTSASMGLCELARGTSSCGTGGFFLLLTTMVVVALVGRFLLGAFGVADPGSTSLLGVGLLAVVALLFLVEVLFEWWMALVIPLAGAASFALSHWVTASFPGREPGDTRHR